MPAEVESVQGEVSSKVDIENGSEDRQEIVGSSTNHDVASGINPVGNGDGNAKKEIDGSRVFSTENNAVGDDPVKSDPDACSVDGNVEKDVKEVEKEGENGNSGKQKMEDRKTDSCPVGVDEESQTMVEPEPERADDLENEGLLPGVGNSENGEAKELESTEKVDESKDSEDGSVDFPDTEGQIKSDRDIDVEGDQGEKVEGRDKSNLDIDVGHKSEIAASKDVKHSADEVKHPVDSDERGESEQVSVEISPDGPIDEGLSLGQSVQTDSGPTVNLPESVENDGIRVKSVAVTEAFPVEKMESGVKVSASENNGDAQLVSEVEKVHASDDKFAIGSESGAHRASDCDEKGDVLSESGATEVASLNLNGDGHSKAQIVTYPSLDAGANTQSMSQAQEIPNSDANIHFESESGSIEAPVVNLDVNIPFETEMAAAPDLDEDGKTQLVSQDMKVSDYDENSCVQSDSEVVKAHDSVQNIEVQSETRVVSDGIGNIHSESQHISEPAADQDRQLHVASEATGIPTCDQDIGAQLEPNAVDIPAFDERGDVTGPVEGNVPTTAIADALPDQQEPEHNGHSELDEGHSTAALCVDGPAENVIRLDQSSDVSVRGSSEDLGLDMDQKIKSDNQLGQEVTDVKEKCASTRPGLESAVEASSVVGATANVCENTTEEPKSSPTWGLSAKASDEKTETPYVNLNGSLSGSDSKTTVSELMKSSSDDAVGSESEAVQSGKTCSETPVNAPTTDDGKIETEVEKSPVVNVTEAISKDVSEDVTTEEVPETEALDTKEGSVIDAAEEAESGTKSLQSTNSSNVNNGKAEAVFEHDPSENDDDSSCTTTRVASETKASDRDLKSEVALSTDTTPTETDDVVSEAVTGSMGSQPAGNEEGTDVIENEDRMSTCSAMDEKAEVETQSELRCTVATADATDPKVASTCGDGDETSAKVRVDGAIQKDQTSTSSREGSADASEGHAVAAEMERKPFYFLPRVPRYDDEKLAEQMKHAEAEVLQKTQSRDAIRAETQKIKVTCKEYDSNFRAAIAEEKSAREALQSKRKEVDSLQSVINRAKSAISVDDIDTRMHRMEHMMQHETLPLKEEKQFIREIKQLKQLREQISSSMGTQDEVQQALDDKEKTEESLKVLRKELDTLRGKLSKAEAVTKAARERYHVECNKQKELLDQFKAADAVRQEAYAHLQSLRKQLREKNKYFFKYRDDSTAAYEMALRKEREALQCFCVDQVEAFMNMWNNDEEFRKYYIRCNKRSTLRRLGTLDGRSLGPDEEPPQITRATSERTDKLRTSNERAEKHEIVPPVSIQQEKVFHFEDAKVEDAKPVATTAEKKNQNNKSKKLAKPTPPPSSLASILIEEAAPEEEPQPKLTKEEEELIRKAEEKRQQEQAAKLKEQRRVEEITKAKEAMERKKKKEEKAKARAATRAQREAEEKEKEREKKLRKKERRKAATSEETAFATSETALPTSETQTDIPEEIEPAEKQITQSQPKKLHKPSQFLKQNKSKSIPPPLRNRSSKRRLQQWMWVALIALLAVALFLLGNTNLSFLPSNLWFLM